MSPVKKIVVESVEVSILERESMNYPNFEDVDTEYDDKYHSFIDWKAGRKCIYLQALND